ncbi:hypothetical protein M432DRAFT_603053 [Thermoascus aurantiacus ATCC 26904]
MTFKFCSLDPGWVGGCVFFFFSSTCPFYYYFPFFDFASFPRSSRSSSGLSCTESGPSALHLSLYCRCDWHGWSSPQWSCMYVCMQNLSLCVYLLLTLNVILLSF